MIADSIIFDDFSNNISIVQVKKNDMEFLELSTENDTIHTNRFIGVQELGRVTFSIDNIPTDSQLLNLWRRSGKSPTFIETNEKNFLKVGNTDKKPACFSGDTKKTFISNSNTSGRLYFFTGKGKRKNR